MTSPFTYEFLAWTKNDKINGTYIVVDPCYIFPDCDWLNICKNIFDQNGGHGVIKVTGPVSGFVYYGSTCNGDGLYPVFKKNKEVGECGVDAGLLCFCPIELAVALYKIDHPDENNDITDDGIVIEVDGELDYSTSGDWICGEVEVQTSDVDAEDEDTEWDVDVLQDEDDA